MSEEKPLTQSEAEERKEALDQEHPGKVPGEGAGPAEATPTGQRRTDDTTADEAVGAGPSGGAETGGGVSGDSEATGAGPSGGADTGGGETGGGVEGAGPSGGATP